MVDYANISELNALSKINTRTRNLDYDPYEFIHEQSNFYGRNTYHDPTSYLR